jgi:hypothetical protein
MIRLGRKRGYVYRRPVKRSHYNNFRRQLLVTVFFLAAFGGVGYFIYSGLHRPPAKSATSAVENIQITGNKRTFTNDYFQFDDTGTWVIDKNNTTAKKIVYDEFRKNVLEHTLVVYINQVPIPLYLATTRVLPVRIINNNSFQATNVSNACITAYAKGALHQVKEVSLSGTTMLCDPDSPTYSVVLGEINGDYQLNLRRPNGAPIQFVIIYQDDGLSPQPDNLINIASSFQTR